MISRGASTSTSRRQGERGSLGPRVNVVTTVSPCYFRFELGGGGSSGKPLALTGFGAGV